MTLQEALQQARGAYKHVDGEIAGTHTVSKANFDPGYYADFKRDDPKERSPFSTSHYWEPDKLDWITGYAGEDGWEPR